MSRKLFPTQEIGSLKKPSWLLKTVKNPRTSNQEKVKARNDAALLNIRTLEDLGLDIVYDGEVRRVGKSFLDIFDSPCNFKNKTRRSICNNKF